MASSLQLACTINKKKTKVINLMAINDFVLRLWYPFKRFAEGDHQCVFQTLFLQDS